MKSIIRVGDKVVCVEESRHHHIGTVGELYTVKEGNDSYSIVLEEDEASLSVMTERFELYKEPNKPLYMSDEAGCY